MSDSSFRARDGLLLGSKLWLSGLSFRDDRLSIRVTGWSSAFPQAGLDAAPPTAVAATRADSKMAGEIEGPEGCMSVDGQALRVEVELPLGEIASRVDVFESFDLYVRLGETLTRIPSPYWLGDLRLRHGQHGFLPFVTSKGNLSMTVLRHRRRVPEGLARPPLRGVICVMQINWSGGKTQAMLSLASALAQAGAHMTLAVLRLTRVGPAFSFPDDVDLDFADTSQAATPCDPEFDVLPEGWSASTAAKARVAAYFRQLDADFVYLPNYDNDELYETIHRSLPEHVLRVLGDHSGTRSWELAEGGGLEDNDGNRHFLAASRRFDLLHVLVESAGRAYGELVDTPVACIPNVVEVEDEVDCARFADSRRIAVIARLHELKQVDHAIRAFAATEAVSREWCLDIYGKGEQKTALVALAAELGVNESVAFHGFDADIRARLRESAVHLSVSRFESFGLTFIEAMNCGVPVLTYGGHPGADALVAAGEHGVVVPQGDEGALATAIDDLVQRIERGDSDLVATVQRAFQFSLSFGKKPIGQRWLETLTACVQRKRAQG